MKKIPTIFVRDMSKQPALVTPEWKPGCEWVRDGEGVATHKYDGTSCLIRNGKLYKRRELKKGQPEPADFERADYDEETGKTVGWVPVGDSAEDQWHREAFAALSPKLNGTYELVGPKIQGNKEKYPSSTLLKHSDAVELRTAPRTFEALRDWLEEAQLEGLVWHHEDGRMAKIKRRDFGFKW